MATVDPVALRISIAKDSSGKLKQAATIRAKQVFNESVLQLQSDFEESPVTREIDGGIASSNISDTLRGGPEPENLFAFIGFHEGDTPTEPIRQRLSPDSRDGPKLGQARKSSTTSSAYDFQIKPPNLEAIYSKTPMPWGPGLSWAEMVETDIPGFAHFLAHFTANPNSRSGGGLQVAPEVHPGAEFIAPKDGYLTEMVAAFLDRIGQYAKGGLRQKFKQPPL